MKFCKKYRELMQRQQERLPGVSYVEFKKFKKIFKHCTAKCHKQNSTRLSSDEGNSSNEVNDINADGDGISRGCRTCCPVCDRMFFPSLLNEMAAVVCCFNTRAKQLLELHLATGFRKYLAWLTRKRTGDHLTMIEEGENLVKYASINALAMRKILKKYDKETLFDPVSLKCGHIFCFSCACSAAAVTIVDGLYSANPNSKCPLCRQRRVFGDAVRLGELSILLSKSCQEYWEQRLQREKVERLRQAKEHWENQCRAFVGF